MLLSENWLSRTYACCNLYVHQIFGTFMYLDTHSSVRSWQILYVNYVLQYVNGNAASFKIIGLSVQEKKLIDFQDGGHLWFQIKTLLATFVIFDLKLPQYFQPSFESIGPSVQKKKLKTDHQDGDHLEVSIWQNDFSCLWSTSRPTISYQVLSQLAFRFGRKSTK